MRRRGRRRRAGAEFYIPSPCADPIGSAVPRGVRHEAEFGVLLWLAFGDDGATSRSSPAFNSLVDAIAAHDAEVARRTAEQQVATPSKA